MGYMHMTMLLLVYYRSLPHCVGCIYRLMEQKIDQLTEMTAEFTRRFQGWEKRWPFKTGAQ